MGFSVPVGKNSFDVEVRFSTDEIMLIGFNAQMLSRIFREGRVYEMCDTEGYGSVSLNPLIDTHISRIKIYQELCHEILSVVVD